jgi:transcriptional antiterminator Rof (Rho-off)
MDNYAPIACDLYDQLVEAATRRRAVTLRRADNAAQVVILDIFTRGGAEWALLEGGETVRLDAGEWSVDKG